MAGAEEPKETRFDNPLLEALEVGDPEMGGAKPLTVEGLRRLWEDPGEILHGRHLAGGVRPPDGRGRPRQAFTTSPLPAPPAGPPGRPIPPPSGEKPLTGRRVRTRWELPAARRLGQEVAMLFHLRGYRVAEHPTPPSPVGFRAEKGERDYLIFCGPFAEPLTRDTVMECIRIVERAGAARGFIFTRGRISSTLWRAFADHELIYLIDSRERAEIRARMGLDRTGKGAGK